MLNRMDTERFGVTVDCCLRSEPSYLACKMTLKARGGNPLLGRPGLGDHQKYRGQNWSVVREEKSSTDCSDISLRDLGLLHQLFLLLGSVCMGRVVFLFGLGFLPLYTCAD